MEGKPRIIHRDIKSDNILLDENLNAKISDFGLSKFHFRSQQATTIRTKHIVGTNFYLDPEYLTSGKYKKESDVYSFGVVLFEMLSGRLAYESICIEENEKGLAPIARRRFNEKTLKELIDPKMLDEDGEHVVILNRGPNVESFEAFSRIAYQCLAETQAKRLTMEAVIKELENALYLQGGVVVFSRFRLGDIRLATKNFSETCCIGLHDYGMVYKAELDDFDNKLLLAFKEKSNGEWPKTWPKTSINVAIKRISVSTDVKQRFFSEIERRISCKHPNIVDVLGFCDEGDEIILVYENASDKSLDCYLRNVDNMDNLTWTQRLHMCLGIAYGLNHLHTKIDSQERLIHGNITSASILLGKNREPKVAYFGISEFHLANQKASTLISTQVYRDPEFEKTHVMKKESDIYSFGVILLEIFCGRLAYDPIYIESNQNGLPHVARDHFNDGKIKILLDPKLKEVTDDIFTSNKGPNQDSLDTFLKIAYQCLEEAQAKRPPMERVIKELMRALNFQM
ncbi:putative receptor-like protein kinase At2g23200 [Bidens hawaiensis]|uniref:putative receptor-like protein kinase At2g23200 n=1 Tax=Bidens hawaiensis TaxID=980011 RepID=UPI00404A548C